MENHLAKIPTKSIDDVALSVRSGPFGSNLLKTNYIDDGVIVLRPFNIKDATTESENLVYISEKECKAQSLYLYKEGDLAFARVGDIRCGVISDYGKPITISPNIIVAQIDSGQINPYFLSIYMNTLLGNLQMERGLKVVAQPTITVETIKTVRIPNFPREIQDEIAEFFHLSQKNRRDSQKLYSEAEKLLLAALGLDKLDLSPQLSYTTTSDEVKTATRFDPDYYQPKYQKAMAILGKSGKQLEDVARLAKRRFVPHPNIPFQYIEISDITNDGQVESNTIPGEDAPSRAQFIVKTNDVITSTVRPIRRLSALIEPGQNGYVCSSGFAVLEPIDIEPELLLIYLRLPILAEILDLHTTATMYPAISTVDLMQIPITKPDASISNEIVIKVKQARAAQKEAKQLLEIAKQRVEQMILGE